MYSNGVLDASAQAISRGQTNLCFCACQRLAFGLKRFARVEKLELAAELRLNALSASWKAGDAWMQESFRMLHVI
ncbi:hypothetical protein AWB80_03362 [Caballeronia pedi]|uniref:Uncharacterized protein n=1 Tax=Caballeronia pedi TaxID=1777141 RepID=A0A158BDJ1_9BURK|nr:hypothetical protein AWB80_03362 [Caballeronia pedi]